jgi:hypothetical protein
MKKTTKKTASKARTSKAKKNLEIKPDKMNTVRGGGKAQGGPILAGWDVKGNQKV